MLATLLPAASGNDPAIEIIAAEVTAISGGSVYLDKGRDDGVREDDRVLFYPSGASPFEAVVRKVSKSSCRIDLPSTARKLSVADRAEVLVPAARLEQLEATRAADAAADAEAEAARVIPDHPEWTAKPKEWDGQTPLLATAWNQPPEDKPSRLRGRIFFQGQKIWDDEFGNNEFTTGRLGTEVYLENPFEHGGEIHVDGEFTLRRTQLEFGTDSSTTRGRLDRLSYSWGGRRQEEQFFEAGRFLQNEFPELGVLDGVEYVQRTQSGSRFGASLGYMPEQFPHMTTGEDLQVAAFYRSQTDDPRDLSVGVAYQSTWHKGSRDRNLFLTTLDWNPTERLSLYGSAWVDYYDSSDKIKSSGFELTEFRLNGLYRVDKDTGFGAHASHTRWPELLRNQLQSATAAQILDNETSRFGVSAWHRPNEHVRIDTRVNQWEDEDDSGGSGDVRLALRNLLYERGEVSIGYFTTMGSFTDGTGIRLSANRSFLGGAFFTMSWEDAQYDRDTQGSGSETLDQQTLRASVDMILSAMNNLSVYVEQRSGDGQDSQNVGMFFQQRF